MTAETPTLLCNFRQQQPYWLYTRKMGIMVFLHIHAVQMELDVSFYCNHAGLQCHAVSLTWDKGLLISTLLSYTKLSRNYSHARTDRRYTLDALQSRPADVCDLAALVLLLLNEYLHQSMLSAAGNKGKPPEFSTVCPRWLRKPSCPHQDAMHSSTCVIEQNTIRLNMTVRVKMTTSTR